MQKAYVAGTGHYVPEGIVTNQDLIDRFGIDTDNEWIVSRTGIEARRFAKIGEGTTDIALPAAEQALEEAGLKADELDMIIFATLSPDYVFPGSACLLQERLGAPGIAALDIRNQCSGFIYALSTGAAMIQGGMKNILVVGAEKHSSGLDLTTEGRNVACLFGDGAGAVVLRATDDEERGVQWWTLGADGRYADDLCQTVWDMKKSCFFDTDEEGNGVVQRSDMFAKMNGRKVFKQAVEKMIGSIMSMCWENKIDLEDVDLFCFHQANLRINQYIQEQLKLPDEKCPANIQRFGNTTAATIPLLLSECVDDGRLKEGMTVACIAFGAGFTWGASLIRW